MFSYRRIENIWGNSGSLVEISGPGTISPLMQTQKNCASLAPRKRQGQIEETWWNMSRFWLTCVHTCSQLRLVFKTETSMTDSITWDYKTKTLLLSRPSLQKLSCILYIYIHTHIMSNVWTIRRRRLEPVGKRHCRMLSNGKEGVQSWWEAINETAWLQ